ncbi:hypothetical protein [Acetivibrio straminisolvens]|uniref:Uncharacterized protein n=1 Tax=Acetivibrio straminisolvens JCM 21531 TaxID=1294263 RepID=W4V7N6_9FIRM|nr:hypothetical protein [Acetivibrio straminisolvens]GAE88823.1 hypothetical protein JCM21531_2301 [Acetivibrio straminisolvens JCM 21531]
MAEYKFGVDFLTLIADRKYKKEILKLLFDCRCHLIDVIYVKGTVKSEYFRDMLGLVPEEKRVMITGLIAGNLSGQLLEQLVTKLNFEKPNTGIAFVVPVDKLSV